MVNDTKISLLLSGLHPAVCFSIAPLSNTISAAWLFPRIEEKGRDGSNQKLKFLKQGFSEICSLLNLRSRTPFGHI